MVEASRGYALICILIDRLACCRKSCGEMKRRAKQRSGRSAQLIGLGLVLVVSGLVQTGCMKDDTSAGDFRVDLTAVEPIDELRRLGAETLARRAICYSGYREGQSPASEVYPTDAEVLEDLKLLEEAGFGLLRVYNSRGHGEQVIRVIEENNLDFKIQLGAYFKGAHAEYGEENIAELDAAIRLANAYPEIVAAVSVGNEVLVSWSFVAVPPEEMVAYIRYVRGAIEQPVTVNDNWEPYAAAVDSPIHKVWGQIDYASVHTYAYWDAAFNLWDFRQLDVAADDRDEAAMAAAIAYANKNFLAVREALDAGGLDMPIVIGETGWQSVPTAFLGDAFEPDFASVLAGEQPQTSYFSAMMEWAYGPDMSAPGDGHSRPAAMFYFVAFDEPWKQADDNWGLWDAERQPKPVRETLR